jgi:hypothetical protein
MGSESKDNFGSQVPGTLAWRCYWESSKEWDGDSDTENLPLLGDNCAFEDLIRTERGVGLRNYIPGRSSIDPSSSRTLGVRVAT